LICESLDPKNSAELRAGSGPVVIFVAAARHLWRETRDANDSLDVQTGLGMLATVMQRGSRDGTAARNAQDRRTGESM
jgi:hypothetical protein